MNSPSRLRGLAIVAALALFLTIAVSAPAQDGETPADTPAAEQPADGEGSGDAALTGGGPADGEMGEEAPADGEMAEEAPATDVYVEIELPDPAPPTAQNPEIITAKDKVRAIWVDMGGDELYNTEIQVRNVVQTIGEARFTDIYLVVLRGGTAMYLSDVVPASVALLPELEDPVRLFLDTAAAFTEKKSGLQRPLNVHLVILPLEAYQGKSLVAAGPNNVLRRNAEWLLVTDTGRDRQLGDVFGLDPGVDAVQDYTAEIVNELVTRYPDAAGVQLFELRYPGTTGRWGYGRESLRTYSRETGATSRPSPEDEQFTQWRRDRLSQLAERLTAEVKNNAPNMIVSIAGSAEGDPPRDMDDWMEGPIYSGALQDWVSWAENGVADYVVLMNSQSEKYDPGKFQDWNSFAMGLEGDPKFVVGMGQAENFAEDILTQLRYGLASGAHGVALYSFQEPNIEDIRTPLFIALADGLFSEDETKVFRRRNIAIDPEYLSYLQLDNIDEDVTRPSIDLLATDDEREALFGSEEEEVAATPQVEDETPERQLLLPDEIVLKNAQVLRGRIVDETGGSIIFRLDSGFQVNVARDEIAEIRRANQ